MRHPFCIPLHIFLFSFSLVLTSHAASAFYPLPPQIADRFAEFKSVKDDVTIVFLGSSHTQGSIIPPVVDATFSELGAPQRAYNLGIRAGYNHQVNHMLDRVLRLRPKSLKLIVIEPLGWRTQSFDLQDFLDFMWWHTPNETLSVLRSTALQRASFPAHLKNIVHHLRAAGIRSFNIGMFSAYQVDDPQPEHVSGWVPFALLRGGKHQRNDFLKGTSRFQNQLAAYPARRAGKPRFGQYNLKAQQDQIQKLHRKGISLVYLLPPSLLDYNEIRELYRTGAIPALIDQSDPEEFPEYYSPDNRHDWSHLGEQGGAIFSASVARSLFEMVPELRPDRAPADSIASE